MNQKQSKSKADREKERKKEEVDAYWQCGFAKRDSFLFDNSLILFHANQANMSPMHKNYPVGRNVANGLIGWKCYDI